LRCYLTVINGGWVTSALTRGEGGA
jgi:hypothetical protein